MRARQIVKRGFTLVETVVTVGIIGALAAVVYPTVVKQFDTADPTRAAEDLNSIRTGIETFGVNVRPNQPQDLEDLANKINTSAAEDLTALGIAYTPNDQKNWNGPYIGVSIDSGVTYTTTVITTGFGATIQNGLPLFDVNIVSPVGGNEVATSSAAAADFLSVKVTNLSGPAFNAINLLIDGPNENTPALRRAFGRFRCPYTAAPTPVPADNAVCTAAYFLASPLRQ